MSPLPLVFAVMCGNFDMVQILLLDRYLIYDVNQYAVYYAVWLQFSSIFDLLVIHGADCTRTYGDDNLTLLDVACLTPAGVDTTTLFTLVKLGVQLNCPEKCLNVRARDFVEEIREFLCTNDNDSGNNGHEKREGRPGA
jgi:uncharacterized protein YuzB (UPF0349 family)